MADIPRELPREQEHFAVTSQSQQKDGNMSTSHDKTGSNQTFDWKQQPQADSVYRQLVDDFCSECEFANVLRTRMLKETGTRLIDWVDHVSVSRATQLNGDSVESKLLEIGYQLDEESEEGRWYTHDEGLFVPICISTGEVRRLVLRVDAVDDFLAAHEIHSVEIEGQRWGQIRRAKIVSSGNFEFWVCERHGLNSWSVPDTADQVAAMAARHFELFKLRRREFENDQGGFVLVQSLVRAAIKDLGADWACDLFFAAEREYWQRRNHAARVQKSRQDRLGLGWANHDHHTYRSSRASFKPMIEAFELLGFHCRERFYAGEEAGWGAQVLEHPGCGIVIFADVDLSPAELAGDFAHEGLSEKAEVGTVGLWCQLHGEAFFQAGMHHLECTFDFDEARAQLELEGVSSMAPFTDFGYLRQSFTTGEVWKSIPSRTEVAVAKGWITRQQADQFINEGTVGSHMEILERNEGFKGFNQTGVSDIILKTDPRKLKPGQ